MRPLLRSVRWLPVLLGAAATLVLFGLADLIARLIGPNSAPLLALGQAIIPLTPTSIIKPVIAIFGDNDKLVLVATVGLGALVLGGLIGWFGSVRPRAALAAFTLAGLVPAVVVLTAPGARLLDLIPTLLGLAVGLVVLGVGLRMEDRSPAAGDAAPTPAEAVVPPRVTDDTAPSAPPPVTRLLTRSPSRQRPTSRRRFLALTGTAAVIGAIGVAAGQSLVTLTREAGAAAANFVLPRAARRARPIPPEASLGVGGIEPFITDQKDFYRIDTVLAPPTIDPRTWSLRIHGMVENEVTLTMDELLALPLEEQHTTLTCVSNPVGGDLVGTATWLGYPVRELLRRARPQPGADMVLSKSDDGFSASTPLEAMLDDRDALLAVGMNGQPLTPVHGFPARLVVAGLYGFVSATKWVTELEVTRFDRAEAYWTQRGWDAKAPILVASRIDVPRPLARVAAGTVVAGGSAWAQTRGIERVEVRLDDGDWTEAELGADVSDDTWRQWRAEFPDVGAGTHAITVRAVDGEGTVQTAERRESIPNSATGHHRIQFTVE
ncbi:molybdopterin-dependent oxidoreductase [Brevibacterium casei]|uniref:DMSO/TMAO reductase YedYZ, molybdopterin-dependent catalytic subunit n=2 Tax=Brevibacterium casei TaxID=33889 RepID=A0A2H1HKK3_9MICO|nr:molybdopterin-dependent oxidoreductase [Brevibacterium casei]PAK96719.1 oxidoreductase [Brevibacterium casei]QPR38745.1 molybdopterin-dependent oxidoreductase [Brevibacterium casei]QPR42910.1 molybdopterin-dependent oxidoreductase [Brevibacterium casei]SMX63400.1 DMSO/TMAO reductase YedYZ, molybdopterin-dependent catalytic subunit [Brevibacterium casei CIP 102111]